MFGIAGIVVAGIGVASSAYASNEANKAAKDANKQAGFLGQQQLAFSREQYEDWQRVYGPIQQRLSNYYSSLDPADLAASTIADMSKQYQQVVLDFDKSAAQRGITSAAAETAKAQLALDFSRDKAEIRQQAPMQVAREQQTFLNGSVTNPAAAGVQNAMINQQQYQAGIANQQSAQAAQAAQAVGQTVTSALTSYYDNKAYNDRLSVLAGEK